MEASTPVAGSQAPMYTQIGHENVRHARGLWKEKLEAPPTLELKQRNAERDMSILRGKLGDRDGAVRAQLLHEDKRIVCFLLSSTFTDTASERNLLIADVVPYLQRFARKHNFDFRLVEMRWGIRAEASSAHQTSEICMAELERCQRDSQGFSYVFLGCQKYGFRPFPAKIPKDVFEDLRKEMSAEGQGLVDQCFRLDTNVYDATTATAAEDTAGITAGGLSEWHYGAADGAPGPVYVLQSSGQFGKDWWPMFEQMQVAFRQAALELWSEKEGLLRDPHSQAFLKRFFISVTEEEFSRGLLWLSEEDQREKTLVFRRTIDDLASQAGDEAGKPWLFMDVKDKAVDTEAQTLLQQQLAMVPKHVETLAYDAIQWGPGIDHANPEHQRYLRKFLDDFCDKMMASISAGAQRLAVEPDAVVEEAQQHLRFALVRAKKFTSTSSTKRVEDAAERYFADLSAAGAESGTALVIYGRSGAGKTYLLSQIMARCLGAHAAGGCVVIRFLGTTPRSSNVHALLTSLCEQLRRAYGKEAEVPSEFQDLRAYFAAAVKEWPSAEQPLTLFIDSVDQLDDSNGGRRLEWLPVTGLSPHVKLVVSTLPDYPEFQCLTFLKRKLEGIMHSQVVEVETISEPEIVLMHLLRLQGRALTDGQLRHVLDAFDKRKDADAAGTPLWLTIVAQAVSAWTSYDGLDCADGVPFAIAPAARTLITDLFGRLVVAHGEALVRAALAYITLAENGVSETELNQLLSLADDVLESVYEWWVPPVRIVPPLLVTRLLTDLAPYLTRRGDGSGAELVSWYHRQFWEAAGAWLFEMAEGGEGIKQQRHRELADFFAGRWAGASKPYSDGLMKCVQRPQFFPDEAAADRQVATQPLVLEGNLFDPDQACKLNTRRAHELVRHLTRSRQIDRAVHELTSPEYIAAKFALRDGAELMREYAEAIEVFGKSSLPHAAEAAETLRRCRATVGSFLKLLEQQPPMMALQMCSQQPDQHPLCLAARAYLAGRRRRVVTWVNKHQALDPCQLEIREHAGVVNSVAYFPDGERLASASDDGTVKVFSTVSGEVLLELPGHEGGAKCVTVSPDGKTLASGGKDGAVKVWDAKTGKCESTLTGHSELVRCVAFDPQKPNILASCSHDKTIKIWNIESGACQSTLTGHTGSVYCVGFDPSGKKLVSGSGDQTVKVWSIGSSGTFECESTLTGHTSFVLGVCFDKTGKKLASCSADQTIMVWDATTGEPIGSPLAGHSDYVRCVAFDPQKPNILASCSDDRTIKIWDIESGACQSTLTGHSELVRCVAFDPQKPNILASCSHDKTIKIWNIESGACQSTLTGHSDYVNSVCFSADGDLLVSGSDDTTLKIWSKGSSGNFECKSTLTGHTGLVTQVEFIDADTVVSSSNDGTTRAWDVATGTQKAEFEGDKFSFTRSSGGNEQTVGAYVVTKKDNLVLVHRTHALKHNEPTAESSQAVAFFRAPGVVQTLECAGDRIAVGCQNGEVLHLQAPWLVDF